MRGGAARHAFMKTVQPIFQNPFEAFNRSAGIGVVENPYPIFALARGLQASRAVIIAAPAVIRSISRQRLPGPPA